VIPLILVLPQVILAPVLTQMIPLVLVALFLLQALFLKILRNLIALYS
jgi:hypothetical protein